MLDGIHKAFLAGVGATVVTLDAVESGLRYLVKRGKLTAEEARQAAKRIMEEGRKEAQEAGGEWGARFTHALQRANLVTQDQLRELQARVAALEERHVAGEDAHARE